MTQPTAIPNPQMPDRVLVEFCLGCGKLGKAVRPEGPHPDDLRICPCGRPFALVRYQLTRRMAKLKRRGTR